MGASVRWGRLTNMDLGMNLKLFIMSKKENESKQDGERERLMKSRGVGRGEEDSSRLVWSINQLVEKKNENNIIILV